jgi:hypothetical protein
LISIVYFVQLTLVLQRLARSQIEGIEMFLFVGLGNASEYEEREKGEYDEHDEKHEEHASPEEYRQHVKKLFCQPHKTMVDVILNKDG